MTLKTITEVEDFVRGLGILATGGGGEPSKGLALLEASLKEGREFNWIDADEIPDEEWTVSCWGMGSIAPQDSSHATLREKLGLPAEKQRTNLDRAVRELEAYTGVKVRAMVPSELGGENTPGPMVAAQQLGIPVVDGDYTGRAAPEVVHATTLLCGLPLLPLSCVDGWGNTCILKEAVSPEMTERIGKYISMASVSPVYMAGILVKGKDLKRSLVRGTLTWAYRVGKAVREARQAGRDPVQEAVSAGGGFRLFEGRVTRKDWSDRDGYLFGDITIQGDGAYAGQEARIWMKNENHILWINSEPCVTTPDLICIIDAQSSEPYTNTRLPEGARVAVIGFPGAKAWRTPEGLRWIGPSYFGFDIPYVPVEERYGR
jgi:DUF917 family protein